MKLSEPREVLAYGQFYRRNNTLLLFCYDIFGSSKYGYLNFLTVETVAR